MLLKLSGLGFLQLSPCQWQGALQANSVLINSYSRLESAGSFGDTFAAQRC
jgi:hypothetical protein